MAQISSALPSSKYGNPLSIGKPQGYWAQVRLVLDHPWQLILQLCLSVQVLYLVLTIFSTGGLL